MDLRRQVQEIMASPEFLDWASGNTNTSVSVLPEVCCVPHRRPWGGGTQVAPPQRTEGCFQTAEPQLAGHHLGWQKP